MNSARHLIISILLSIALVLVGALGYVLIEGWVFFDAVYMTALTLSTVGFKEVHDLSFTGQVFTVVLIFFGVGFTLYVAGAIVQFMVEGQVQVILGRRRVDRKLSRLKNHYIVCGYGRIGRVLSGYLKNGGQSLAVIEKDSGQIKTMEADDIPFISGDASEEENLIKAGIGRAAGLVAALATDTQNVFLVLTARQLNPELYIVARAGAQGSAVKLKAAGATVVESPYEKGAVSMAQRILRPTVTSFLDLALAQQNNDIQMEEIPVDARSRLVQVMLKDSGIRQEFNLIIIAVKKKGGEMLFNPSFETVIEAGDTMIAVGQKTGLQALQEVLHPGENQIL